MTKQRKKWRVFTTKQRTYLAAVYRNILRSINCVKDPITKTTDICAQNSNNGHMARLRIRKIITVHEQLVEIT